MAAGQRDRTGCALWWGLGAGFLLTAAGYGDERHLRSLLFAGVILTCGALVTLVIRWGFSGQVPGSVTPISEAGGALAVAVENARQIDILDLRTRELVSLMQDAALNTGRPHVPPAPRNAVILQFPGGRARSQSGTEAG
jgi:hypothetical protein